MLKHLNNKITEIVASPSECSPTHLSNHFIDAHGVVSDYRWASFIAALPCARETKHRIISRWKAWAKKKI